MSYTTDQYESKNSVQTLQNLRHAASSQSWNDTVSEASDSHHKSLHGVKQIEDMMKKIFRGLKSLQSG